MLPSVGTVRKFFARTRLPAFGLPPGYHSNSSVGRACLCPTCTAMNTIG